MNWMVTFGAPLFIAGLVAVSWSLYYEPISAMHTLGLIGIAIGGMTLFVGSLPELDRRDHARRMETWPVYRAEQKERCRTKDGCECGACRT